MEFSWLDTYVNWRLCFYFLEAMKASDKGPGKFYQLVKVHKAHTPPQLPQGRLIISGCG